MQVRLAEKCACPVDIPGHEADERQIVRDRPFTGLVDSLFPLGILHGTFAAITGFMTTPIRG
jgi:hypothetical protein